jgi:hypothetical protein
MTNKLALVRDRRGPIKDRRANAAECDEAAYLYADVLLKAEANRLDLLFWKAAAHYWQAFAVVMLFAVAVYMIWKG